MKKTNYLNALLSEQQWLSTVVIALSTLLLSLCNPNNENKKINELLITSGQSNKSNASAENKNKNQINEFLIKPLTDSTYTGEAEERYPNGIVKYKGFYRFGKKHGEWLYFYPNGNLWSEAVFNRDKMHGKSTVYHPNGKIYYTGYYKNNLRDSIWTYYDTAGNEIYKELYKNGKVLKRENIRK
ncbi:MAG: hypothetical protein KatS3mg028_0756 [Bacteroidia bacterium]|nr:MAG: hypothetical protein KatS3mg028_0756 [Bacteroidia bacterium]